MCRLKPAEGSASLGASTSSRMNMLHAAVAVRFLRRAPQSFLKMPSTWDPFSSLLQPLPQSVHKAQA